MNGVPGYAGAIVNPSLALAIESTRQYLKGSALKDFSKDEPLITANAFPQWPGNQLPCVDDAEQLLKWQPDCRASVLCFEALSGMSFAVLPEGAAKNDRNGAELRVWDKPLVTMTRPDLKVLQQQARRVSDEAQFRLMPKSDNVPSRDRLTEITSQVVPPFAFWCSVLPIHPDRMPRTIELIELTLTLSSFAEQRFKHALAVARPNQIDATVIPAVLTPAHASLPSGHATEAFAVGNVLLSLLSGERQDASGKSNPDRASRSASTTGRKLLALAARIANNRQVAGLHYPIDTFAGRLLGTVLADYLVSRCVVGRPCQAGTFSGANLKVSADAQDRLVRENGVEVIGPDEDGQALAQSKDPICVFSSYLGKISTSAPLSWLWTRAREEWGAAKEVTE